MLAGMRSCFLLSFLLAFSVAACLPVQAQINGVPPSVTSFGFGGSNNPTPGVRASVTSLGPNGYGNSWPVFGNCCANFFLPANPNPPLFSGRRHRRKDKDHADFPVGIIEPAYIPYAVPYVQEADDDSPDIDYVHAPGTRNSDPPTKRAGDRDSAPKADASDKPTPGEPEEPVAVQPSTVLVFKDGHRSDVVNYAIVGDTLFDFGAGRTHKILLADLDLPATQKANDDRGVDFQIPARAAR
ncbi:MAG: hypothetical protein ABR920_04740 [Terriglobales bacterium]